MYNGIELPILDAFNPLLTHFYHLEMRFTTVDKLLPLPMRLTPMRCVFTLRECILPCGDAFYPIVPA